MPVRWVYHLESFRQAGSPSAAEALVRLIPNLQASGIKGSGSSHLWMAGIYGGSADGMCTTLAARHKEFEVCDIRPGGELWNALYPAVRSGLRISAFHVHGDLAVDYILLLIEQASAEGGMDLDAIRAKRHVLDHCRANPRVDQIARAAHLGVTFTCGPKYIVSAATTVARFGYDPEAFARQVLPVQSMIEAGLRPGFHLDRDQSRPLFKYLQMLMTRKDLSGRVWNAAEAVDRRDALRMATRWNAAILDRSDQLGSLEPGKWADMVVLDGDLLSIPLTDIPGTRVLMTLVGGKVIFEAADADL